jgi:hypothetical protein
MNMELHSTGASFIAEKSDHNPRDLVIEAVKAMPEAGRKERFERFWVSLGDVGVDYHRAVAWYFFVNMHDYLTTDRNRPDPIERAQARVVQTDRVEKIKAQIIMLDLTMPNGKAMRDCTGAEMSKFGNRFQRIAEKVGKAKTVGSVLSEDQVKTILK